MSERFPACVVKLLSELLCVLFCADSSQATKENGQRRLRILLVELHGDADGGVERAGQLLVKRLLLLQARYENFEELFQCCYCQVLAAIVVDRHLLHLGVLFDELSLLGLQRYFPVAFALLRR